MTMSKTTRLVILVVVLAAAAFAIFFRGSSENASTAAKGTQQAAATALPKLIDLGSTTCIPCKKMEPILESLSLRYEGRLEVEFIDIQWNKDASFQYGIRLIPTQIFLAADGRELFRHEGFFAEDEILAKWKELGVDLDATPES